MEYIPFNYYTISLLLGGFTALISGIVVYVRDYKRPENQVWFALTMSTAVWSFSYFLMTISNSHDTAIVMNWILHYAAILTPLLYYLLVLTITNRFQKNKFNFMVSTVLALGLMAVTTSPQFVADVVPKVGFNFVPSPGFLYIYFFLYFVLLILIGLITTAKAIFTAKDRSVKLRFFYTMVFTIAASLGGGSVFVTTFFDQIPPYLLILFSIYPVISGYAILKYQLFDTKLIVAQVFMFVIWIFIFARILLSESLREQIANGVLLLVTIILGIFLIRTIKREVAQREKIEILAKDLEKANNHLLEVDKQKSEFVSFATHQLRAPLAAMKGYSSMILEGDLGTLSDDAKEAVSRIFQSSKTLASVVDDYLNVSRIELGTMKYDLTRLDLTEMIHDVIDEIKPNITKSGLAFSTVINPSIHFFVNADRDKLKQVITNIIDNSIKYTPKGSLIIGLDRNGDKVKFSVKDTGIGISAETMPKLFSKFARAHNANKANIHGTGLGLFVAKDIVTAHKGKIWAESQGDGKGSQFYMELDLIK